MLDKRAHIYNDLAFWEKSKSIYPIHKRLLPFYHKNKRCTDVNDALLVEFDADESHRVLDVGCGVGNTLLQFAVKLNIRGYGISISANEAALAREHSKNLGVDHLVTFQRQSFDEPIAFNYQKAIAIESLKHSFDIEHTAANLFQSANTDALVFVIDDFFVGHDEFDRLSITLKKDWNLRKLYSREDFVSAFRRAGFEEVGTIDFTQSVLPKSTVVLQLKIALFSLLQKIHPNSTKKNLLAIFKSGFILELLFQRGLFTYECLVFRKPAVSNNHLS